MLVFHFEIIFPSDDLASAPVQLTWPLCLLFFFPSIARWLDEYELPPFACAVRPQRRCQKRPTIEGETEVAGRIRPESFFRLSASRLSKQFLRPVITISTLLFGARPLGTDRDFSLLKSNRCQQTPTADRASARIRRPDGWEANRERTRRGRKIKSRYDE